VSDVARCRHARVERATGAFKRRCRGEWPTTLSLNRRRQHSEKSSARAVCVLVECTVCAAAQASGGANPPCVRWAARSPPQWQEGVEAYSEEGHLIGQSSRRPRADACCISNAGGVVMGGLPRRSCPRQMLCQRGAHVAAIVSHSAQCCAELRVMYVRHGAHGAAARDV